MTFNDNADISRSRVRRRGRSTGIAVGGGGVGIVLLFLAAQLLGVDLGALTGDTGSGGGVTSSEACLTGEDANQSVDCRMDGAYVSLDAYWATEAARLGIDYRQPGFVLFDQSTSTGCGVASGSTGPFYCPPDEAIFIDTAFFGALRSTYGATGGPLAELYVAAHEWGHHIQLLSGAFAAADRSASGPDSDSVRLELQADCFAGAWAGSASTVPDESGVPFLRPITDAQIADALNAAEAIGDDRLQEAAGGEVEPESWTHGSSEQRQRWFLAGFEQGAASCDTFAVNPGAL